MHDRLGPYRLLDTLGEGSFGVVYRAVREGSETPVALKVLSDLQVLDQEDLQRFWLEGQVARRLVDPGVVAGLELGEASGRYFLAMEYVPGQTLKERLANGPLELSEAVSILVSLAETLARVHAEGVIHRDLKPANVIVDARTFTPRIMDFGLARDRSLLRSLTRTGDILGTPVYMAPEQIQGKRDLDHRIDVYALGAIFYECVTGQRPHLAKGFYALEQQIVYEHPTPPSHIRSGLSRRVDRVCARALAKDPNDRYPDCSAFAAALGALLGEETTQRRSLWLWAVVPPVFAITVGAGLAWSRWAEPPSPVPAPSSARAKPAPPPTDLLAAARRVRALAMEGSGSEAKRLAQTWVQAARERPIDDLTPGELDALASLYELAGYARDRVRLVEVRVKGKLAEAGLAASSAEIAPLVEVARRVAFDAGIVDWVERVDLAHARLLIARGEYGQADEVLGRRLPGFRPNAADRGRLLQCFVEQSKRSGWNVGPQLLSRLAERAGSSSLVGRVASSFTALHLSSRRRTRDPEIRARRLAAAERSARSALRLDPNFVPALIALASALTWQDSNAAASAWQRAREVAPRDSRVAWAEARAYRRRDQKIAARARDRFLGLTHGTRSYTRARFLRDRGWERVVAGHPGAGADLEEVRETRPFDMRPWLGLGVLALRAGKRDAAAKSILMAASLAPEPGRGKGIGAYLSALPTSESKDAYLLTPPPILEVARALPEAHRGPVLALLERATSSGASYSEVTKELRSAAAVKPDVAPAALLRAKIAVGRHLFTLAVEELKRCEALGAPRDPLALLRADLALRQGRRAEAKALYRKLARTEGLQGRFAKAELLLLSGQLEAARAIAEGLLKEAPGRARPHVVRALTLVERDPVSALMSAARARAIQGDLDVRAILAQHRAHLGCLRIKRRAWLPSSHYKAIPLLTPSAGARLVLVGTSLAVMREGVLPGLLEHAGTLLDDARTRDPQHPRLHLFSGWHSLLAGGSATKVLAAWERFRKLDAESQIPREARRRFVERHPRSAAALRALAPRSP